MIAGTHIPTEEEFKPQKVNGKWRKPKRSARVRAKMKKLAMIHNLDVWKHEFEPVRVSLMVNGWMGR